MEIAKTGEIWKIASAGVNAVKGMRAQNNMSNLMQSRGVNLNDHLSQPLTQKLLNNHYWILVMESIHRESIIQANPELINRVYTVREFGLSEPPDEPDMPDPTGSDNLNDYYDLLNILNYEIPRIVRILPIKNSDIEGSKYYDLQR